MKQKYKSCPNCGSSEHPPVMHATIGGQARRLCIRNETHFVNFADSDAGMALAKTFRKSHPAFKGRRIRQVLQLKPSEVPFGEIMEVTYR